MMASGFIAIAICFLVAWRVSWAWVIKSNLNYKHWRLFVFWLCVSAFLSVAIAVWPEIYIDLRFKKLGAGVALEPAAWLDSVAPENREEAIDLYHSNMGVGWPVTAFFLYVLFGIPLSIIFTVLSKWIGVYGRRSKYT